MDSYLRGYQHDVFLSFAAFDDRAGRAAAGWMARLRKHLVAEVLQQLGHGVDVATSSSEDSQDQIAAVRGSGVLIVLLSSAYKRSPGDRDIGWFSSAGERRCGLVPVLLNNLPRDQWPSACRDADAVVFCDTADTEYGHRFEPGTAAYDRAMQELGNRVVTVLLQLREQDPVEADASQGEAAFTVFLAATSDDLARDARRLEKELKRRTRFRIAIGGGIPPPWDVAEHTAAVLSELASADLAIHLLGPFPGRPIAEEGPKSTYPLEQLRLGRERGRSQLLLLSETIDQLEDEDADEEDAWYRDFLAKLATAERDSARLELVRAGRHRLADEVIAKLERIADDRRQAVAAACRTAFVDVHQNDLPSAAELLACLARNDVGLIAVPASELTPAEGMKRFEENLCRAQLFVVVFGAVAHGWVEERLEAAMKLVISRRLTTRMCVCVPSATRRTEVPFHNLVDVVVGSDPASIERVLRKLDGEDG